ncbi:hypothetical protein QWA_18599 [Alcaligenes faecalis subsp. faecalis NCIB 8687]|nr:hypothetical protein QWA_18599 [Alcaligenes faecalis subsp. faecalis NCIB 8687]
MGYFGCRDEHGNFSPERFAERAIEQSGIQGNFQLLNQARDRGLGLKRVNRKMGVMNVERNTDPLTGLNNRRGPGSFTTDGVNQHPITRKSIEPAGRQSLIQNLMRELAQHHEITVFAREYDSRCDLKLASEGLVTIEPRRGASVAVLSANAKMKPP